MSRNGSGSVQVTITNTREVTLRLTRALATPFGVSGACAATLAPGASCTLTYRRDGAPDLVGFQAADARLRLENAAGGYLQKSTIVLTGEAVDGISEDGFE